MKTSSKKTKSPPAEEGFAGWKTARKKSSLFTKYPTFCPADSLLPPAPLPRGAHLRQVACESALLFQSSSWDCTQASFAKGRSLPALPPVPDRSNRLARCSAYRDGARVSSLPFNSVWIALILFLPARIVNARRTTKKAPPCGGACTLKKPFYLTQTRGRWRARRSAGRRFQCRR